MLEKNVDKEAEKIEWKCVISTFIDQMFDFVSHVCVWIRKVTKF